MKKSNFTSFIVTFLVCFSLVALICYSVYRVNTSNDAVKTNSNEMAKSIGEVEIVHAEPQEESLVSILDEMVKVEKPESVEIEYIDMGVTHEIDLDYDGKMENITFNLTPLDEEDDWLTSFDIHINDLSTADIIDSNDDLYDTQPTGFFDKKLAIVSVPAYDEKLIVLSDFGPSDDYVSEFFVFKYNEIRYLGNAQGMLDTGSLIIENDGTIFSANRSNYMQTWFYVCENIIHRNEIVSIHRNMYPISTFSFIPDVEYKSTTLMDYDFYLEPNEWSGRTTLPAGTEIQFTGSSETGWVEFESNGSRYYVYMTGFFFIDGNKNLTSDLLFSDLIFAD